jgi:hypothetical protein
MTFALAALLSLPVQEEGVSIWEAKFRHEKALLKISGVKRLSIGGIGENMNIIVTVDSWKAGQTVKKMTRGKLDGWPIHISLSRSKSTEKGGGRQTFPGCSHCPTHCPRGGKTVVGPPRIVPEPDNPEELCDIARKLLGKARRADARGSAICHQMVGWTNNAKKKEWVRKNNLPQWGSKAMGQQLDKQGNPVFIAYTYIRHRRGCPIYRHTVLPNVDRLTPKTP